MNKLSTLIALSCAATAATMGTAHAGDIDAEVNAAMFAPSTVSRAAVQAAGVAARPSWNPALSEVDAAMAPKRLVAPRPMTAGAMPADLAAAVLGEDSGSFFLAQAARPATALVANRR